MTDDSKSFEKKLDRDFFSYLSLTKVLYDKITDENEKELCGVWLTHLVGKNFNSASEKCNRNIYLSRLLLQMQSGKLQGIFQESPPSEALPSAFTIFGLPTEVEGLRGYEETGFQVDKTIAGGSGDFSETSRDGRTYVATKHIPQGMMAYMAVTNNDGQEIWRPQPCPPAGFIPLATSTPKKFDREIGAFVKKLGQCVKQPLSNLRKSPEEREMVLEWLDKVISDCNKWIQGEDPHNKDLETLFEMLYQDYKEDPEKIEILKHPKKLRTILIKDIRDRIADKREEVSKRELILDQYEAEQYVEERRPGQDLDDVWLQCAKKPMSHTTTVTLEATYPPEVIERFFELLYQERIYIIEKGERDVNKRIADLRSGSTDDIKKVLLQLKKVQQEYKEYYAVYKDIEAKESEYAKEWKVKCIKPDKSDQKGKYEKLKREIESQLEHSKKNFDAERKTEHDLLAKLEEAKEAYLKVEEEMRSEAEKLNCQKNQLQKRNEEIRSEIESLKKKQQELKCKLSKKRHKRNF